MAAIEQIGQLYRSLSSYCTAADAKPGFEFQVEGLAHAAILETEYWWLQNEKALELEAYSGTFSCLHGIYDAILARADPPCEL